MGHGTMVICQQHATPQDEGKEVGWTNEDLDTLRHESHHLVQDCIGGVKGDLQLVPVFTTRDGLESFIDGVLTQEEVDQITTTYSSVGATDEVIWIEIETFAVARNRLMPGPLPEQSVVSVRLTNVTDTTQPLTNFP